MTGTTGGITSEEFDRLAREREILTVRCARCVWSRTGFASRVLSEQRTHVARCEERHKLSAARQARYRARYPERVREAKRRWYEENKEAALEAGRRYKRAHRAEQAAYLRAWRARKKEAA